MQRLRPGRRLPHVDPAAPAPREVSRHTERHPEIVGWFEEAQFHALALVRDVVCFSGTKPAERTDWRPEYLAAGQVDELEARIEALGPVAETEIGDA